MCELYVFVADIKRRGDESAGTEERAWVEFKCTSRVLWTVTGGVLSMRQKYRSNGREMQKKLPELLVHSLSSWFTKWMRLSGGFPCPPPTRKEGALGHAGAGSFSIFFGAGRKA